MNKDVLRWLVLLSYLVVGYLLGSRISRLYDGTPYEELAFALYFTLVPVGGVVAILLMRMHAQSFRTHVIARVLLALLTLTILLIVGFYAALFNWSNVL